jgi:hypothetical protein
MSLYFQFITKILNEKQREIIRYWLKFIPAYFYKNDLSKLARHYGTDKFEHGYTEIYSTYFEKVKNKKLRILEIGIGGGENTKFGGNSLKMWANYFPKSEILGIDIYDKSLLDYRRIKTFQGSQSDEKFLSQFDNFDVIIDDGSHINSDVIKSFEILFPKLNKGGYYCVEDTQVSGSREFTKENYLETLSYFKQINLSSSKVNLYTGLVLIEKMN